MGSNPVKLRHQSRVADLGSNPVKLGHRGLQIWARGLRIPVKLGVEDRRFGLGGKNPGEIETSGVAELGLNPVKLGHRGLRIPV